MKVVQFTASSATGFAGRLVVSPAPGTTQTRLMLGDEIGRSVRVLLSRSDLNEIVTALLDEGAVDNRNREDAL